MAQKFEQYKESLDGVWKFRYAPNYKDAPKGFEMPEYDCKGWEDIRVPAHIQMEGYGKPQYTNVQYPWDGHEVIVPGEIPTQFNPTASYVKYFTIPSRFAQKRVFISFQGVESGFALWCNGSYVGYSEDSFTPAEFELTPFVHEGENKLAVCVFKWTSGSWCEDQDFFRFSGIFRSVYLYAIPDSHICDLKIKTDLNTDYTKADLKVVMTAITQNTAKADLMLCYHGTRILSFETTLADGENVPVAVSVEHPQLWSAEKPNLYDLLITVYNSAGEITELIPQKVGFRRFAIENGVMTLNGKRIVFKGVNRHEFSGRIGRVPDANELRKDIITMKQNNINAIRTSHIQHIM